MEVRFDEAVALFDRLGDRALPPSLHPAYVAADARRDRELRPVFFAHEDGGEIYLHGFHTAPVPGAEYSDIQSAYGYGGPVASTADPAFLDAAWRAYGEWCRDNGILAEFVRFHPLLENWRYFGGTVMDDRWTVWVDLTADDLATGYEVRVRTAIRKARNGGVRVVWRRGAGDAAVFGELYRATMTRLDADEFYRFDDDYLASLMAWDRTHLGLCLAGDEVVAAALFLEGNQMLEYHLSAATPEGKRLAATNLLLHEAALLGQRLGCRALHLGGGFDGREDNPLLFFKSGFSPLRGMFRIGRLIHQPEAYAALRGQWLERHGTVPARVLFYRF